MPDQPSKMKWKDYSKELRKLQTELCHLQEWVRKEGLRVIIVFAVSYTHLTLPTILLV